MHSSTQHRGCYSAEALPKFLATSVDMGDRAHRGRLPFTVYAENFTDKCFVDEEVLRAQGVGVLRAFFENERQEEVLAHVPTAQFFALHTLDPQNMGLWDHMNLRGFFELPPWGPDYMRAYQALSTITDNNECTITNLHGRRITLTLTRRLVREALNLSEGDGVEFFKLRHDDGDNAVCSARDRPVWDQLLRQRIRLALQLHMQHFHITYPHRWTMPEKTLATEYSLRDMRGEGIKFDYAHYLLFEFQRGKKSIEASRQSKAKRHMPLYLGGVLVITRIIYYALNASDELPPAVEMPQGITAKHYTRKMPMDVPPKRKKTPPRQDRAEKTPRPNTRNAAQEAQKKETAKEAPHEETEEELILKALNLSRNEAETSSQQAPPDTQELEEAQLREALRRSIYETHISQEHQPDRMVSTVEGILCTEIDMARVREVLIHFSQDPEAVISLRNALQMLQQEKEKYNEEKEERERERKRKEREDEIEKSKKDKGKGKVDEGTPSDGKSLSPPPSSQHPIPNIPRSQTQTMEDLPSVRAQILSWNEKIERQTAEWLSEDAKAQFEVQKQEDLKQARLARQRNEELLEGWKGLTEVSLPQRDIMETHLQDNLEEVNRNLNQRRELRNTIQNQANLLAYQSDEYRMWIDLLNETGLGIRQGEHYKQRNEGTASRKGKGLIDQ